MTPYVQAMATLGSLLALAEQGRLGSLTTAEVSALHAYCHGAFMTMGRAKDFILQPNPRSRAAALEGIACLTGDGAPPAGPAGDCCEGNAW